MKKKALIGSVIVIVVILLCLFYFLVLKNSKNKIVTEGVEVVPTMNDMVNSDSTWCGTFQLVWNDMINEVVGQDILFEDNNDMVTNLNKKDFNTSMISEEYYYKKYGFKTLSLKKEIEQGIKEKFNQTVIALGNAIALKDDSKMAEEFKNTIPMFEELGKAAEEVTK